MNEHLLMLGRFVRSPRTVGAVAPSSRALAEEMVKGLDLSAPTNVVELGPGTGVVTRVIAQRLGPKSKALAIDVEPAFVAAIARRFPRVEAVCGSAADLPALLRERGMFPAAHIISGLPFASLSSEVTTAILDAIAESLEHGGT